MSATEYERAATAIKSQIKPADVGRLITVPRIEELTGTTYSTALRAAKHLAAGGILRAHQGKGYEIIATPEDAATQRADMQEITACLARLQSQIHALAARPEVPTDLTETLERLEFNLEALHGKLGIPYPGDGASEEELPAGGET